MAATNLQIRPVIGDSRSIHSYPSALVDVAVQQPGVENVGHVIRLPELEVFRIRAILQKGEYALPTRHGLPTAPFVVDIGANVGLFALYMKLMHPLSVVHCYEPVPSTLALLERNTASLESVHIHPYALGEKDGDQPIFLHPRNTGESSFKGSQRDANSAFSLCVPMRETSSELSRLARRIDVLKIDTEGYEVEILESLGAGLRQIRYVLVEYHSEADRRRIDKCLSQFRLCGAGGVRRNRGTLKYERLVT